MSNETFCKPRLNRICRDIFARAREYAGADRRSQDVEFMADASVTAKHSSASDRPSLNDWLQAHPLRALLAFVGAQILIWTLVPWALGWSLPLDVVCEGLSWGREWQW